MFDVLIIGGGIHGMHLFHVLRERVGLASTQVQVLDPHDTPLLQWKAHTAHVGMTHLRSTRAHHIGLHSNELLHFAERRFPGELLQHFGAAPYNQPSLALFDAHCQTMLAQDQWQASWWQGVAKGLSLHPNELEVSTEGGVLRARAVVLALGMGELRWPAWARAAKDSCRSVAVERIFHVLAPSFARHTLPLDGPVAVVGGGMSGAQVALALATERPGEVLLVSRCPFQEAWFDTDPGWVGPRLLRGFWAESELCKRREMIAQARGAATITPPVWQALEAAIKVGALAHHVASIEACDVSAGGCTLALSGHAGAGLALHVGSVVLATGLVAQRPDLTWLRQAIRAHDLPCAPCGTPALSEHLEWRGGGQETGLFAMGALAELVLGPTARNIAGARTGAARIAAGLAAMGIGQAQPSSLWRPL